jgi:hypothetical protein
MEENEDLNSDGEDSPDSEEMFLVEKIFNSVMVFNSHFAHYISQNDKELFKRAVDYAKTFTEEDVPGIIMHYMEEDTDEDTGS